MSDPWIDRLSEYLDDELSVDARRELEAHLQECEPCSAVLQELRRVVGKARGLTDIKPPDHLWESIASQLQRPGQAAVEAEDVAPRTVRRVTSSQPWYLRNSVTLPLPQMLAACLVLMVVSASVGWFAHPGGEMRPTDIDPRVAQEIDSSPNTQLAGAPRMQPVDESFWADSGAEVAAVRWEEAVRDQELVFRQMKAQLDTTTVRVLEKNLGILDHSIEELREAKAEDPDNSFLDNRLANSMKRKLRLLRWASTISTRET